MKRSDLIRLVCYLAAVALILFHPVRTVLRFSFPASKGVEVRFRVTAYDPYDPMRGRYVRLNLRDASRVRLPKKNRDLGFRSGQPVFAVLDITGPAIIDLVAERKDVPPGKFFLPVRYQWFNRDWDQKKKKLLKTGTHTVKLPFERFYLNEKKAPEVERLLQQRNSKAELSVIIFRDGVYRVHNLIVNGQYVRGR